MKLVRLGIANTASTVGATRTNADAVITAARRAASDDVWLLAFPEQALGGYPAEDLVQWHGFVAAQRDALARVASETRELPTILVIGAVIGVDGLLFNGAAVLHRGVILGVVPKEKLPTYDVFYEARTLARGTPYLSIDSGGIPVGDFVFRIGGRTLAVEVCEDGWSPDGPMRRRCFSGADLVVNISASPFRVGIVSTRREMLATRSADNQCLLLAVNAIGGQDGLVFDGGGGVHQNGRLLHDAPRFQEGVSTCTVDLDRTRRLRTEHTTWRSDCDAFRASARPVPTIASDGATASSSELTYPMPPGGSFFLPADEVPRTSPRDDVLDDVFEALALGLRDYFAKSGAFSRFGVALSGGRDSLMALLVTWRAAQLQSGAAPGSRGAESGADLISAFYMPSRFSGADTRRAAETICEELGIVLTVSPIDDAFDREVEATRAMLGATPTPLTLQNIQARIRGQRMWNWANSSGALFVQTSDMSEKAVGYTTIGGDLEGALSVIANVPKTVVIALLERLRERFGLRGIDACLGTAPGPELAADQVAEADLMPFPVLDACLYLFASEKLSPKEVAKALSALFPTVSHDQARHFATRFAQLFTQSIYKWVQSPLALHVGTLDLDRERALQLPVVQRAEWWGEDD